MFHRLKFIIPTLGQFRALSTRPLNSQYLNAQKIREAQRRLIMAEYELLKHQNPDSVPIELDEKYIDYLSSLTNTRVTGGLKLRSILDLSYKLRRRALNNIRQLENFETLHDGQNSLVLPFIGSENDRLHQRLQTSSIPFSPNLIFDISFDDIMSSLECKNLAEQLIHIFNLNKFGIQVDSFNTSKPRSNYNLFNLHVTNLGSSHLTSHFLHSLIGHQLCRYPNVFLYENSLIDIFKGQKLVYLSPHAEETMKEYDNDAFYIIGGIVDRREIVELTPNRCASLGIPLVKLPLDSKVHKNIQSLYDVFKLIHELKYNSSSPDLYKHLPKRKKRLSRSI